MNQQFCKCNEKDKPKNESKRFAKIILIIITKKWQSYN